MKRRHCHGWPLRYRLARVAASTQYYSQYYSRGQGLRLLFFLLVRFFFAGLCAFFFLRFFVLYQKGRHIILVVDINRRRKNCN